MEGKDDAASTVTKKEVDDVFASLNRIDGIEATTKGMEEKIDTVTKTVGDLSSALTNFINASNDKTDKANKELPKKEEQEEEKKEEEDKDGKSKKSDSEVVLLKDELATMKKAIDDLTAAKVETPKVPEVAKAKEDDTVVTKSVSEPKPPETGLPGEVVKKSISQQAEEAAAKYRTPKMYAEMDNLRNRNNVLKRQVELNEKKYGRFLN